MSHFKRESLSFQPNSINASCTRRFYTKFLTVFSLLTIFVVSSITAPAQNSSQPPLEPVNNSIVHQPTFAAGLLDFFSFLGFGSSPDETPKPRGSRPISPAVEHPSDSFGTVTKGDDIPDAPNAVSCTGAPGTTRVVTPGTGTYPTIQSAITASSTSLQDIIQIPAGTYTEQLDIRRCVTLMGMGANQSSVVIKSPPSLNTNVGLNTASIIQVDNGTKAIIKNLTVEGTVPMNACNPPDTYGIFVIEASTLTMSDVTVNNIRSANPAYYGCQNGVAIRAGSFSFSETGTLDFTRVTVSNYQKTGIIVSNSGSNATIKDSLIKGFGEQADIGQNGIQVNSGATATITNNRIEGNVCDAPATPGDPGCGFNSYYSYGLIVFDSGNFTASGNTFTNNDGGIFSDTDASTATITGNTFNVTRYAGIDVWEGNAVVSNNFINGGVFAGAVNGPQVGVSVTAYDANDPNSPATNNTSAMLTSNSISGAILAGVLIDDYNTSDIFAPTATAHFNRFADNGSGGNNLDGAVIANVPGIKNNVTSSTVSAENNFWGCNSGPDGGSGCDDIGGLVTALPFLKLTHTASNQAARNVGEMATITTSLRYNSAGDDTYSLLPGNPHLPNPIAATAFSGNTPNGIPISFSVDQYGTVNPGTTSLVDGLAQTTFTATGPVDGGDKTATITAQADNAQHSTTVTVLDTTAPTIVSANGVLSNNVITYTVVFSENVTGVNITNPSDFTLTTTGNVAASITSISTDSGDTRTVQVTVASGMGTVRLNVLDDNTIVDTASAQNPLNGLANNPTFNGQMFTVDNQMPSITIEQAAGQADPTSSSPINFTVVFSESVTGFGNGDVDLSDSTGAGCGALAANVTGSNATYNVAVSGMNGNCTVVAKIPANAAVDSTNNGNSASTSTDNSVTYLQAVVTNINTGLTYPTIQAANDAPETLNGHTIRASASVYLEQVNVTKSLTIQGAQFNQDARTGRTNPNNESTVGIAAGAFVVQSSVTVTIDGFKLTGADDGAAPQDDRPALALNAGSGHQIINNVIEGNQRGAYFSSPNTTFKHNRLNNSTDGFFGGVDNTTVEENLFTGGHPDGAVNTTISSGDTTVDNYRFINNVSLSSGNFGVIFATVGSEISGNTITNTSGSALFVGGGNSNLNVQNNTFTGTQRQAIIVSDFGFGYGNNSNVNFNGNAVTRSITDANNAFSTIDYRGVAGSNEIFGNTITLAQAAGTTTNPTGYGVRVRGSGSGNFDITGNVFNGGGLIANGTTNPATSGVILSSNQPNPDEPIDPMNPPNPPTPATNYGLLPATSVININCNSFTGFQNGIVAYDYVNSTPGGLPTGIDVNANGDNFLGNSPFGINNSGTSETIDATNSYWNSPSGPTNAGNPGGTGDAVSANVDYTPFLPSPSTCAPVNNVPATASVGQDTPLVFSGANQISITDLDASSNPVTVTLSVTNGTLTLSGTNGLTFTTGDGTNDVTMTFSGTLANINAALNNLTFNPTPGYVGSSTLTIMSSSMGSPGVGGGTQSDTDTVSINVLDTIAPMVTIDQASGQVDPTSASPITFDVVFSEPVTDFDASDVNTTGSSAFTVAPTINVSGSGATYTVTISGMTRSGTVKASIPAGAAMDAQGNPSAASTSTDNTVFFNFIAGNTNNPESVNPTNVSTPFSLTQFFFLDESPSGGIASGAFVTGPTTPPLPIGSARLTIDSTGRENIATRRYAGTRLADISSLQYSAYTNRNDGLTITLQFDVDYNETGTFQNRLVYEPAAQGIAVTANTWQTFDTLAGKFYSSANPSTNPNNPGVLAGCIQATPCTRQQLLTAFPNVKILGGPGASFPGAIYLRAGGPFAGGMVANTDNLIVGINGNTTTFNFEPTPPTISISDASVTEGNAGTTTANFTVSLSQASTLDTTVTVTTADGTATTADGDYVAIAPANQTVTIPAASTTATVSVTVNGDTNVEGNETFTVNLSNAINAAIDDGQGVGTINNDDVSVTINQAAGQNDPTNATTINFTVVFSEPVTGFDGSDISFAGSTAGGTLMATVTPASGATYNVAVTGMTTNGTVVASIPAGAAMGAFATNTASTSMDNSVYYDGTAPTVTINQAAGQLDPTTVSPINFTVVFSESVANFDSSDVVVSGTAGATTASVSAGPGTTYNVQVTPPMSGTVVVTIAGGVATDAAGNGNTAATGDNMVTYFTTAASMVVDDDGMAALNMDGTPNCDALTAAPSLIQTAINLSTAGDTIQVCPGTYIQELIVDKPLTILGPNATVNPNTNPRNSNDPLTEAIIKPLMTDTSFGGILVTFTAQNITFNGFTLDGDNPALTSGTLLNGADVDVGVGIDTIGNCDVNNNCPGITNQKATVAYNIIKNIAELGVELLGNNAANNDNSTVQNNKIDNIPGIQYGGGIYVGNNAYANITGNVLTHVSLGIITENFGSNGSSATASLVSNNTIQANRIGIRHNLHYNYNGPGFKISNNTITSYVETADPTATRFSGIRIESINTPVKAEFSGNTITPDRDALLAARAASSKAAGSVFYQKLDTPRRAATKDAAAKVAAPSVALPSGYTRIDGIFLTNTSTVSPNITITGNNITNALRGISDNVPAVVNVNCNYIANNVVGIYVGHDVQYQNTGDPVSDSYATGGINISQNNIVGNTTYGVQNDQSMGNPPLPAGSTTIPQSNAMMNYWGAANGPGPVGPGSGDKVTTNVDFSNFLTSPSTCTPVSPPTVMINQAGGQFDPTNTQPINFTVVFSEAVTGFTNSDVVLSGTAGNLAGATITVTGSGTTYNVAVSGLTTDGTVTATIPVGAAQSMSTGSPTSASTSTDNTVTYDTTAPTVTSVTRGTPATQNTNASSVTFNVTFSEAVTGVDTSDFTKTGTISGGTVSGVTTTDNITYAVTVSGYTGNGTLGLDVNNSGTGISDTAGNPLSGGFTGGETYIIDQTNPTVTSIARDTASPTNASSVTFTVTFSEAVTGVDAGDFVLATTGGVTGASITSVSADSGNTRTVTVNTGSGNGTIGLNLVDDDSIIDAFNNPLGGTGTTGAGDGSFTGAVYTIDKTAPTVVSSVQAFGSTDPTNASTVTFTVTFSEAVTGVDTTDFALTTTGSVTGANVASVTPVGGGGTTYNVVVNTGSGDGTIRLDVFDDDTIVDTANNSLNGGFTTGAFFTIDKTVPTVSSIVTANPNPTNASSVTFTVTFSEAVTGVDAGDFMLATTGVTGASITGVTGSGATRTVTVNTGTGDGTIGLNLVDNDSIIDAAGNPLGGAGTTGAGDGSFTGQVYTVDKTAPTVVSSNIIGTSPTNAASVQFLVTFSEAVTGVDNSDFTPTTTGGISGVSVTGVTGSGTTYTVTVNTGSGDGTIRLDVINDGSIKDAASNPLSGAFNSGQVYTIDRSNPTVSSINRSGTTPTNAASINFTVTFSEAVTGVDTGDFILATTGVTGASITGVTGSGNLYTVTVNTGTGDGTIGLNLIDDDSIKDLANNSLNGTGIGNGNFTGAVYTIDKTAPTVTINQAASQSDPTNTLPINFTVVFSEVTTNFTSSDVTISGAPGAVATVSGSGTTYNVSVSGITQNAIVVATIAAGMATDAAGNGNTASTSSDNQVTYFAPVSIAGTIVDNANQPLQNVTVMLSGTQSGSVMTNASGQYVFTNLPGNGNYLVTPGLAGYTFSPTSRNYTNLTTNITNANFTGSPGTSTPRIVRVVNSYTYPGQNVTVPIELVSQGDENSLLFRVIYDDAYVGNPMVALGANAGAANLQVNDTTPELLVISVDLPTGSTFAAGTQEIVTITFTTASPNTQPNTPITFSGTASDNSVSNANGDNVPATFQNGFVVFAQSVEGDVAGRPNGSGVVNGGDVTIIRQMAVGLLTIDPTTNEFQRADCADRVTKGNGTINSGDVTQVRRYSLGVDAPQTAGGPFQRTGMMRTIEEIIEEAKLEANRNQAVGPIIQVGISLPTSAGSTVTVPIEMSATGAEAALQFSLSYDTTRLTNPVVALGTGVPAGSVVSTNPLVSTTANGQLGILVDSVNTFAAGQRQVVRVTFNVKPTAAPGLAFINFGNMPTTPSTTDANGNDVPMVSYVNGNAIVTSPTAASVEISGRVKNSSGKGVGGAMVTLTDEEGVAHTAKTDLRGRYKIEGIQAGRTYILNVAAKFYSFAPQPVNLLESLADYDLTMQEE